MTDWQRGYGDAYVPGSMRGYPALPNNEDYMKGFQAGQEEWNAARAQYAIDHGIAPNGAYA